MPTKRGNFYPALALLMTALVFVGFWPVYFGVLMGGGGYTRHWVFHLHAVVFLSWMAFLIAQTILVAQRKTKTHMAVGEKGFILAGAVFVMGAVVTAVVVREWFAEGVVTTWPGAAWEASAPVTDITQFAILIALGWRYRRRPEFHKRYMVFATIAILPAATARTAYLLGPWSLEILFAGLIGLLLVRDVGQNGRVHPASLWGILILLPRVFLNISYKFIG
jgi:hypothetical protein